MVCSKAPTTANNSTVEIQFKKVNSVIMPPDRGIEDPHHLRHCITSQTPPPEYSETPPPVPQHPPPESITVVSDTGSATVTTAAAAAAISRRYRHRSHRLARLAHHHHHHHSLRHWRANSPTGSTGYNTNNERSPFLMVKILLFSLMTIDFVMNTIGLAVIVVMAKNHYNNVMVERSLLGGHVASTATPPDPIQSEWSLLLPLLPSFIFAEILTLVGMFGVFCDLFSFTMTYAILKLITSLCYPSMASAAAVAAMTTTTATTTSLSHTPLNGSTLNLMPILIPELSNRTVMPTNWRHPPRHISVLMNVINSTSQPSGGFILANVTRVSPEKLTANFTTTTVAPVVPTESSLLAGVLSTPDSVNPTQPIDSASSDSAITTMPTNVPDPPATTQYPTMMLVKSKHYPNRFKQDIGKDYKTMKKSDRLAKLKAREKQLRSKLLRMESQYHPVLNQTVGIGPTRLRDGRWSEPSQARLSLLLPMDSQSHNIKYHHRVWDALLVTFEVIFAVAFAFNTLGNNNRTRQLPNDYDDEGEFEDIIEDNRSRRRRRRRHRNQSNMHWPYSPLANSIDAFYFAQFQLPPPPPPYFCRSLSPHSSIRIPPTTTTSATEQTNSVRNFLTNRLRILSGNRPSPSTPPSNSIATISSSVPHLASPPQYADIERDATVTVMVVGNNCTGSEANSVDISERIVLQVINPADSRTAQQPQQPVPQSQQSPPTTTTTTMTVATTHNKTELPTIPEEVEPAKETYRIRSTIATAVTDTRV